MRFPWSAGRHKFTRRTAKRAARRVVESPEAERRWAEYLRIKAEDGTESTTTMAALIAYQEEALPWNP